VTSTGQTVSVNGIAHIQLTVRDPERCLPFWERLCNFLEMKTLIRGEDVLYCIGSRTGILVRAAPPDKRDRPFDQDRPGLHHLCFRARSRADVDAICGSTDAVTFTARLRSIRRIEAKPRPGSTSATWLKGTSAPFGVRTRMLSRLPSDRRCSLG